MTSPNGAMLYTQGFGSRPENVEIPIIIDRAPTAQDTQNGFFPVGKRWIDSAGGSEYVLTSYSTAGAVLSATWVLLGSSSGLVISSGNLTLSGTGSKININASPSTAASVGTTAGMTTGAVTITSSAITASSKIIYSRRTGGGGLGAIRISAQAAGSATLTSDDNTETSTFDYLIIN